MGVKVCVSDGVGVRVWLGVKVGVSVSVGVKVCVSDGVGVRVWLEVLPNIGLDPGALKPGTNPFCAMVRASLNDEGKPKKVIGLAV